MTVAQWKTWCDKSCFFTNIFLHTFLCVTLAGSALTVEPMESSFLSDAFSPCDREASNATPGKAEDEGEWITGQKQCDWLIWLNDWLFPFLVTQIYIISYDGHYAGELHSQFSHLVPFVKGALTRHIQACHFFSLNGGRNLNPQKNTGKCQSTQITYYDTCFYEPVCFHTWDADAVLMLWYIG